MIHFLGLKIAAPHPFVSDFVDSRARERMEWKRRIGSLPRPVLDPNASLYRSAARARRRHQRLDDTWAVSGSQEGGCE